MYLSNRERRQKVRLEVDIINEKRNLKIKAALFAGFFVILLGFRVKSVFGLQFL